MKSFDDATRQVAGLMAAIGGNVDAYEDDKSSKVSVSSTLCFDAALASVEAHIQHNEPTQPSASTKGKVASVLNTIEQMNADLDGVSESPFEPDPTEEELFNLTTEEAEITAKLEELVPKVDCEDKQSDGKFWQCLHNDTYLPQVPKPVEPCYKYFSSVYSEGCEELKEIYQAFKFAATTGEPQTVTLDSGACEMTPAFGDTWELHDTGKGRKYCQENVENHCSSADDHHYDLVEEDDLFVWVIADHPCDDEDDLGYIHNQWVFVREQE